MLFRLALPTVLVATSFACGSTSTSTTPATTQDEAGAPSSILPDAFRPISSEGAKIHFIAPADGASVTNPVELSFGASNLNVEKAGKVQSNGGHHHLIIDAGPIPEGEVVPADAQHIHYGGAQTSAKVELPLGKHTITLQFADGLHRSFGPEYAQTISVEVLPAPTAEQAATEPKADTPAPTP